MITTIVIIPLTKSVGSEIARLCNSSEKEIAIKKPKNTKKSQITQKSQNPKKSQKPQKIKKIQKTQNAEAKKSEARYASEYVRKTSGRKKEDTRQKTFVSRVM